MPRTRHAHVTHVPHTRHASASYDGPLSALIELARTEGAAGLLRGIGVSTLRGLLGPGSQVVSDVLEFALQCIEGFNHA